VKSALIRKIYLYLFSLVGLFMMTIGAARLATLGLKIYIFTDADVLYEYPQPRVLSDGNPAETPDPKAIEEFHKKQQRSSRQREAAESLGWLVVGLPLYLYHWSLIKKEKDNES
jgi:hypothetical protein